MARRAPILICIALATVAATAQAQTSLDPAITPIYTATATLSRFVGRVQSARFNHVDRLMYFGVRSGTENGIYSLNRFGRTSLVAASSNPAALMIDGAGNVFYAEDFDGIVYRLDFGAASRTTWATGWHSGDDDPVGMTIVPSGYRGNVVAPGTALVVDRGNSGPDEVWTFNAGTAGVAPVVLHTDNGTLVDPLDITVAGDRIFLIDQRDTAAGRIYEVLAGGALQAINTAATIGKPCGIAVDPLDGRLLITDAESDRLIKVDVTTGAVSNVITGIPMDEGDWANLQVRSDGGIIVITSALGIHEFARCNVSPPGGTWDCNSNGVLDDCEIHRGTAEDCNANGIPDSCDLATSRSPDCNLDGVPDECPSCPSIDAVFFFDTSTSMDGEAAALCADLQGILSELRGRRIPLRSRIMGISAAPGGAYSCLEGHVIGTLGTVVPGNPPSQQATLGSCPGGNEVASEDWGRATSVVAGRWPWAPGFLRVAVPIADEGPWCGDPVTNPGVDRDSITWAIRTATTAGVIVSPIMGSGATTSVTAMAQLVADATRGAWRSTSTGVSNAVVDIVRRACTTFTDCNANFIPDACDTGSGRSRDCNSDGVPDECQPGVANCGADPSAPPLIECMVAGCRVVPGGTLRLRGDSARSRFEYQTFTWRDATGATVTRNVRGMYLTAVDFVAAGFPATSSTFVTVTAVACESGFGAGRCTLPGVAVVNVVPAGSPEISSGVITPFPQPERATYRLAATAIGSWSLVLTRAATGGTSYAEPCPGVELYRRTATSTSGMSGTWPGLSPGGRYCWRAVLNDGVDVLGGIFTLPALPAFTMGPTSRTPAGTTSDAVVTATVSQSMSAEVQYAAGLCSSTPSALRFDGGDAVIVPGQVLPQGAFSIEAWVNLRGVTGQTANLFSAGPGAVFGLDAGRAQLSVVTGAGAQQVASSITLPLNRYVHLAATFAPNGRLRVYVDGVNRGSVVTSGGAWVGTAASTILGDLGAGRLIAEIASMAVYDRELDTLELEAHAAAGADVELGGGAGRLASWAFGEAEGVQSVYDGSGNGVSGMLGSSNGADTADPSRRPPFAGIAQMGVNTRYTTRISGLTDGAAYCYRVVARVIGGPAIASPLGQLARGRDTTAPVVRASPLAVSECSGNASATLTLPLPAVTDDLDPAPVLVARVGATPINFPYTFPLGSTTVRWTATDRSGNVGTADQVVRIADTTPPSATGGGPMVIEAADPAGTPASPMLASASDTCGTVMVTSDAPATFPLGSTLVTFRVVDQGGNEITAQREVRVVDTTPPSFVPALGPLDVGSDGSACFELVPPPPGVRDNAYPPDRIAISFERASTSPGFPACWGLGAHQVVWTIRDPSGNVQTGTQTIDVRAQGAMAVVPVGLESGGAVVAAGRYYAGPVTLLFRVTGATGAVTATLSPAPAMLSDDGAGLYRARYTAAGAYPRIFISARDPGSFASANAAGFGIDLTPPVAGEDLLDQTGVVPGNAATYPVLFLGEHLALDRLIGRDGAVELAALGRGVRLAGDDVIAMPAPVEDGGAYASFTVALWVKPAAAGTVWSAGSGAAATSIEVSGAGDVVLRMGALSVTAPRAIELGGWHHLACTFEGGAMRIWVDGLPGAYRRTSLTRVELGGAPMVVGARLADGTPVAFLSGEIAEVALWKRALDEPELAALWRGGAGTPAAPARDTLAVYPLDDADGQQVTDTSTRAAHGTLGRTAAAGADDPARIALDHPLEGASSGVVTMTARLISAAAGGPAATLFTRTVAPAGAPLAVGERVAAFGSCSGAACPAGGTILRADDVFTWDGGRLGAYTLEVELRDAAGNARTQRTLFRTRSWVEQLRIALGEVDALDVPAFGGPMNELADARESFEVALAYATMQVPYTDGSYLRGDQGGSYLIDAVALNVPAQGLAEHVARAMAGDVNRYVDQLGMGLHPDDRGMWSDAKLYLKDARFERFGRRPLGVQALARSAMDAVALLYPPYQQMRTQRRAARASFDALVAAFGRGEVTAEAVRSDRARTGAAEALTARSADALSAVLFQEIRAALTNPLTTERRSLEELLDVMDKTSNNPDEAGDLMAITNPAIDSACMDRLRVFDLDDREFTLCYLRLNDLAQFLDGVSEPLVHTYRWRAGLALVLFHMLELSMYISPTGLPWITTPVSSQDRVDLVLPDAQAARVPRSVPLSTVDFADRELARSYARHAEAAEELRQGDVNRAWAVFLEERCLLLTMFNRYYSTDRVVPNVADPKEATIDPVSVACPAR